MKKILLLCVAVLIMGSFIDSQAQAVNDWSWSHPRPVGAYLSWCQMFDANTYYVIGGYGNFLKTTNGGNNWLNTTLYSSWRYDN